VLSSDVEWFVGFCVLLCCLDVELVYLCCCDCRMLVLYYWFSLVSLVYDVVLCEMG